MQYFPTKKTRFSRNVSPIAERSERQHLGMTKNHSRCVNHERLRRIIGLLNKRPFPSPLKGRFFTIQKLRASKRQVLKA